MAKWEETVLKLPPHVVDADPSGFSVDLGTELVKVAYRSKEDYENGKPITKEKEGNLHLIQGRKCDMDEMLSHVIKNCATSQQGPDKPTIIRACGIGATSVHENLTEKYNFDIEVVDQFSCFARSAALLARESSNELFHPTCKQGEDRAAPMLEQVQKMQETMAKYTEASFGPSEEMSQPSDHEHLDNFFPFLLAICGTGNVLLKVEEDGSYKVLASLSGGQTFLGMVSALTGITDFDEIMKLAASGDRQSQSTVDTYAFDIMSGDGDDLYSQNTVNSLVFPFGKLVTTDFASVRHDDLVFSLLNTLAMSMTQAMHLHAITNNLHHICVAGNFVHDKINRMLLTEHGTLRKMFAVTPEDQATFHFMKHDGLLGAIGAYMAD